MADLRRVGKSGSGLSLQSLKLSAPAVRFPIIAASITMVAPAPPRSSRCLTLRCAG